MSHFALHRFLIKRRDRQEEGKYVREAACRRLDFLERIAPLVSHGLTD